LVLKDGRIVERAASRPGRSAHEQLLDRQGEYYRIYNSQFQAQEESQGGAAPETGRQPTARLADGLAGSIH
jgi:hypothetical protein